MDFTQEHLSVVLPFSVRIVAQGAAKARDGQQQSCCFNPNHFVIPTSASTGRLECEPEILHFYREKMDVDKSLRGVPKLLDKIWKLLRIIRKIRLLYRTPTY